jgi:CubicO group peptidase (beta-lactamase class C family)
MSCLSRIASVAALGLAILMPYEVFAAAPTSIKSVVDRAMAEFYKTNPQAVAVSVGVYTSGKTYIYNYGATTPGGHRKPTADSIYPIASITKTMTGTLLAQAVLEGKVRLDDDVRKYLVGDYPNLEFEGHPIRLKDLLDHRSGLPFFMPDRPETMPDFEGNVVPWPTRIDNIYKTYTLQDFYNDLHKVKLTAVPGTEFKYSNTGAALMGYILENLYGDSYENLLKKRIFEPLHMSSSTITLTPDQQRRLIPGFDEKGNRMPPHTDAEPAAGAVKSSVYDMLKYARWHMAEDSDVTKLSHKPVLDYGLYTVGLNWQEIRNDDSRIIWQEGNIVGFNSFCIIDMKLKTSLVILANEEDPASAHGQALLANEILKGLNPKSAQMP